MRSLPGPAKPLHIVRNFGRAAETAAPGFQPLTSSASEDGAPQFTRPRLRANPSELIPDLTPRKHHAMDVDVCLAVT